MQKKNIGIFSILFASIMWSVEPIFAKLSYETADFLQTSAIRALGAILVAGFYIILTNKPRVVFEKKEMYPLVYIALMGTLVADVLYFLALTQIQVVNAVVIAHMQPIFIILFSFLFLKSDKLSLFDYFGILFMMLSAILVTTRSLDNLFSLQFGTLGDLFVLSATIVWSTTAIVMRRYLVHMHAGCITLYRFFIAFLFFIPYLVFISDLSTVNLYQMLVGIVVGLGTIFYYEGLKRITAAQASGLELSTPFFATLLAFVILGELVSLLQGIGILLLLVGIACFVKREQSIQGGGNE
ncbi:MAG: DMT family transporter [Thermoplasmatota archaeon]